MSISPEPNENIVRLKRHVDSVKEGLDLFINEMSLDNVVKSQEALSYIADA